MQKIISSQTGSRQVCHIELGMVYRNNPLLLEMFRRVMI